MNNNTIFDNRPFIKKKRSSSDINSSNPLSVIDVNTPLHRAVYDSNRDALLSFVNVGVDINIENARGLTPLHIGAKENKPEIVNILLDKAGADDGNTALHLATFEGNQLIVDSLLDHGADLSAENEKGQTSLHFALRSKNPEITAKLVRRASFHDFKKCDKVGKKPVDYVRSDKAKCILQERYRDFKKEELDQLEQLEAI